MWHIEYAWSGNDSKRSISRNSQIKRRLEQLSWRGKRTWMDSEPWHVIFAIAFMNGDPTHRERRTVRHAFISTYPKSHKLVIFL